MKGSAVALWLKPFWLKFRLRPSVPSWPLRLETRFARGPYRYPNSNLIGRRLAVQRGLGGVAVSSSGGAWPTLKCVVEP